MKKSLLWKSAAEYFKLECDKDISAYFLPHYPHFFPKLAGRSLFVRQDVNLLHVKTAIQQQLTTISGQLNDPVQAIDAFPLPVCVLTRSGRDRCFPAEADFGYCAAKDMRCCGFKLGLRSMITHCPLLPSRPHDIQSIDTLLELFQGIAPADKGFVDAHRHSLLLERHKILAVTPRKKI